MERKAFSLTETLVIGALFGLFVLGGTMVLGAERSRTRDARRIADMTRLAAGFSMLYSQRASYVDAASGCPSLTSDPAKCSLQNVLNDTTELRDPGRFPYVVVRVPDRDDFGIKFHLERSYGTFKAGNHVLTKSGIH